MSTASSLPYKLRPNKAVDRELFLSLLGRLAARLHLERYKYIGLGGPFLEDFRLIHARIGIQDMDCLEVEENVHNRQKFNKPIESISCIHSSLEEHLACNDFDSPIILWLDYNAPKDIPRQIETFATQVLELPVQSIVRITLNANPASLGNPSRSEAASRLPGESDSTATLPTELEWRLERFKERMGEYYPASLVADDMKRLNYGRSLLRALSLAVEAKVLDSHDRKIIWTLATNYSDGTPMVTATLMIVDLGDSEMSSILEDWEYHSTPQAPLVLDLPALSTLERLTMESNENPREQLGFDLPKAFMKEDPFAAFKQFYRVYPHFSRVDL